MKKKRKRSEINYHDPRQRAHPPQGTYPVSSPSIAEKIKVDGLPCHICGKGQFEWGFTKGRHGRFFHEYDISRDGDKVITRRCKTCHNLQFFTE